MTNEKETKVNLSFWLTPEEVERFDEAIKAAKIDSRSKAMRLMIDAVNAGTIKLAGAGVDVGGGK